MISIHRSRESLDSGEIDPEEECIEMLETASINDEYRALQSDLTFYQTPEKRKIKEKCKPSTETNKTKKNSLRDCVRNQDTIILDKRNHTICVPIDFENDITVVDDTSPDASPDTSSGKSDLSKSTAKTDLDTKHENIKNEVIFKNIFGATKNAIFRTAQSIIDNHEKKSKNKSENDEQMVKSPTDISKKKEFFTLKQSLSKSRSQPSSTIVTTPENEQNKTGVVKSTSVQSIKSVNLKEKPKVLAFSKQQIVSSKSKENDPPPKIDKNHSGLLRFFESPVFNIHFAIHYLFYSKEPGVLSFIGNKIFSFKDSDVDLYMPQLILLYIQMDELAEVLDPYLVYRCRRNADFSLKCCWLLEAYNYTAETLNSNTGAKCHLSLLKELYPKKERKQLRNAEILKDDISFSPMRKTHHR